MKKRKPGLPLGFAMALAQNPDAMNNFSRLTATQKESYIAMAKQVKSKSEMKQLVRSIGDRQNYMM